MTDKKTFEKEKEIFERSWKIISLKIPWLYDHYTDPRNRGPEGEIETKADLIAIDDHLKNMQKIIDKWKIDFN